MDLELVSFPLCPFVHRATTLLHEKDAPFSIRYIDLKNKPEWFLALSPRGRVPVLVADRRPLFESAAILEFLDETHGPRLLPDDPFERARERAFISFGSDVFMAQYRYQAAPTDDEVQSAHASLLVQLGAFEQALGEGEYFAGARFGLVDAALAPALLRLDFVAQRSDTRQFGSLHKVERWARALAARPSVLQGLPPDFERLYLESLRANALGKMLR